MSFVVIVTVHQKENAKHTPELFQLAQQYGFECGHKMFGKPFFDHGYYYGGEDDVTAHNFARECHALGLQTKLLKQSWTEPK